MKFDKSIERQSNSDEVVEFYLNKMNLKTKNEDVIRIVKESMKNMPIRDLKILEEFNVDLDITDKNSRYHRPKLLGKLINDKRTIFINPKKYQKGMFAHGFAHYAADVKKIYEDPSFLEILEDVLKNATGYKSKKIQDKEYVYLVSDRFIKEYQGRTYIQISDFKGKLKSSQLKEYISVGYQTYISNPSLLERKDKILYDYFAKRGLSNEK